MYKAEEARKESSYFCSLDEIKQYEILHKDEFEELGKSIKHAAKEGKTTMSYFRTFDSHHENSHEMNLYKKVLESYGYHDITIDVRKDILDKANKQKTEYYFIQFIVTIKWN